MKKFLVLSSLLLIVSAVSQAETVDAVYFNPSRLGRYEMLRISDKLTARGGVEATEMSIATSDNGSGVTLTNNGTYSIANVEAAGTVDMPSTRFTVTNVQASNTGGEATFEQESTINTLTSNSRILTGTLSTSNTMHIQGGSTTDFNGDRAQGLLLGKNYIPVPTGCNNLQFVGRTDKDNKKWNVLACVGEGSCRTSSPYCEVKSGNSCVTKTCNADEDLDISSCTCKKNTVKCLKPFTASITYYEVNDETNCNGAWLCYSHSSGALLSHLPSDALECYVYQSSQYNNYAAIPSGCSAGGECPSCNSKTIYYFNNENWTSYDSTCDSYWVEKHSYSGTLYRCQSYAGSCSGLPVSDF